MRYTKERRAGREQPRREAKRKVLFVTDSLGAGGAERQLVLLATNMPADWGVEVWSLSSGPWSGPLADAGVHLEVRERSWRFDPSPVLALSRRLAFCRPDAVYAQGWMSALAAIPACRVLGIPLVDSRVRGAFIDRHNWYKAYIGFGFADVIVANSAAGLSALWLRSAKSRVIYNGLDSSRAVSRGDLPFTRRPHTAVMAARMHHMKDYDLFLAAAQILESQRPGTWRFLAVGDGPERARLMEKGSELTANGCLEFVPQVDDVMGLLATADVGVLLTNPHRHAEGCSNALLEYMAANLPVVCTDSGGNREVVEDGTTGFLVPAGNAARLAARLSWLAAHPVDARGMGQRGALRVHNEFSLELLVRRTVQALEDACSHRGKSGTHEARDRRPTFNWMK